MDELLAGDVKVGTNEVTLVVIGSVVLDAVD